MYISVSIAAVAAADGEADRLYADRANLASARRAAEIWRPASAGSGPDAFEASWKLARADYWLGGHVPQSESRAIYEEGIAAGRRAIALQGNRPEGHFWVAANMGAMALSAAAKRIELGARMETLDRPAVAVTILTDEFERAREAFQLKLRKRRTAEV